MIGLAGYPGNVPSVTGRWKNSEVQRAHKKQTRPTTRRPVTVSPGQRLLARDRPPAGIL